MPELAAAVSGIFNYGRLCKNVEQNQLNNVTCVNQAVAGKGRLPDYGVKS